VDTDDEADEREQREVADGVAKGAGERPAVGCTNAGACVRATAI